MSDIESVLASLVGEDEWSRHQVLERLREEGAPDAGLDALADTLAGDDASLRSAARMALAALASPDSRARDRARERILDLLRSEDADVRVLAASALGEAGDPAAGPGLIRALRDPEPNVAAAAADALGQLRHAPALDALAEAAVAPSFWVRAAAVVALGRIEDERAIPALAEAARVPGLERPLVEALRQIHHPDALDVLAVIDETAPLDALIAAGAILAAHPEVDAPAWVAERAAAEAEALRVRLIEEDDPAVARVLGTAATPSAIETLIDLVGPPRRSEAALTGLLAVPADLRSAALIEHMEGADRDELVALLALLPPQVDPARIEALLPLLSHDDATVRAATAEALARLPAERRLSLLAAELEREDVVPEAVRAFGGLAPSECGALLPLLRDPAPDVRAAAAEALGRCGGDPVAAALEQALEEEAHPPARQALLRALGAVGGADRLAPLIRAMEDHDPETRLAAIEGLGASRSTEAIPPLRAALDGAVHQALASIRALGDLGQPDVAAVLEPLLGSTEPDLRRAAARAVVPVSDRLPRHLLDGMRRDDDEWVRLAAVRMLARRGPEERKTLERLAEADPSPAVRAEARAALGGKE